VKFCIEKVPVSPLTAAGMVIEPVDADAVQLLFVNLDWTTCVSRNIKPLCSIKRVSSPWARWMMYPVMVTALLFYFGPRTLHGAVKNGFDLSRSLIPVDEIHHGGPARDGIPSIDRPRFVSVDQADYLQDPDRVLGINRNGVTKAYPVMMLNYHEIVNDRFGGEAIVVSYCPLCGTGMAFTASVDGSVRDFGVSGLLYNNDVLLYDRESSSLWSQLMKQAVTGPMRGTRLQQVAMSHTTWGDWRRRYSDTLVLSTETDARRDYQRSPYAGYASSEDVYFPMGEIDHRYHPKEQVIGLSLGDKSKAYPFAELSRTHGKLRDSFSNREILIRFDAENRTGAVFDIDGEEIPSTISYWFAWQAFHPDGEVYTAP